MAEKKLGFKDFLTVDYAPGEPDQMKLNAKKRKKDIPTGNTNEEVESVEEALTLQQRQKRAREMKKYKSRLKVGRERAARKTASVGTLRKRARKAARAMLAKKLTANMDKSDLSYSKKQEIEKRLDKMKSRVDRMAQKLLPKMRKKEQERKHRKAQQK